MKITLHGNPISTNSLYRSGVRGGFPYTYMSNDGRCMKEDYQWQMKQQRKKPLKSPLIVVIYLFFKDKRRRDWDNYHKLSMDAGNGILWEDDSQIRDSIVRKRYDKFNPRIELDIIPLTCEEADAMISITTKNKTHYSV